MHNKRRIVDLICRHKSRLRAALLSRAAGAAAIPVPEWSCIMQQVLDLDGMARDLLLI